MPSIQVTCGGASAGGIHPSASARIALADGIAPSNSAAGVKLTPAVDHDTTLPIRVAKSLRLEPMLDRTAKPLPGATPGEKRKLVADEAVILTWASAGGFLGSLYAGALGGIIGFLLAGYYAALKLTRHS